MAPFKNANEEKSTFGLLDIVRIFGGVLIANAALSWWFTSSTTWGYEGKWIDPSYLKLRIFNNYVNLTLSELSLYNGSDTRLPIYVGVNGKVYDVSANRLVYGPKGSYSKLSGKDAARVFVTGCLMNPEQYTHDLRDLDESEVEQKLGRWQSYFDNHRKYWYVGIVQHGEHEGPIPPPCEQMSYPGGLV